MQGAERERMNIFEKIVKQLEDERLTSISAKEEAIIGMCGASANHYGGEVCAYDKAIKIVKKAAKKSNSGWIPVEERFPEDDKYILLSFSNFSVPCVGRYEEDEEGGAFYLGDEDETCVSQDLFVNAWMPLPPCYKEE